MSSPPIQNVRFGRGGQARRPIRPMPATSGPGIWLTLVPFVIIAGCTKLLKEQDDARTPLARVGKVFLYHQDLQRRVPGIFTVPDSADLIERYVEGWTKDQLILRRAHSAPGLDKENVEQRVDAYRHSLIRQEFLDRYVEDNLVHAIDPQTLSDYYEARSESFLLTEPIVRCRFLAVESSQRESTQLVNALRRANTKALKSSLEKMRGRVRKKHLDDSRWIALSSILSVTPFANISEPASLLKQRKVSRTSSDGVEYFLIIAESRQPGEVAPLEYVAPDIRRILINRRKSKLRDELEKRIYEKGLENEDVEIYSR